MRVVRSLTLVGVAAGLLRLPRRLPGRSARPARHRHTGGDGDHSRHADSQHASSQDSGGQDSGGSQDSGGHGGDRHDAARLPPPSQPSQTRSQLRPQARLQIRSRAWSQAVPAERTYPATNTPGFDPLRDPIAGGYLPPALWPGTELMPRMTEELLAYLDQLHRPAVGRARVTQTWFGPVGNASGPYQPA